MKEWSRKWKASKNPKKQRKYRYNAPLHIKRKFLSAHLSKELRKKYKRRALPLRKGDEVVVMRGKYKKMSGKISRVDLKGGKVYIEGITRKRVAGTEIPVAFEPSNLMIINLYEDKMRLKAKKVGVK
ncbi:MAG: 50S ribosomal protein L24 [Candidatus Aenigmarchaeota archaeon]|nr:50S ribosomal protein L24 [Candidatus Aenigmarchaeota archaeon]MCX8179280.1 50S ribosomal protein L24 [Candidatus Aenigmarchaeota archaeon]